jgi:EmrB/QacA subfamily drug resistance transporter
MTTEVNLIKPVGDDDRGLPGNYKWLVLINTTLATLLATLDASIILIALPNIFRGIGMDPLAPGNSFYLLWMILGFMAVTAVLVVSFGRLGDMFGRVKMFNFGFATFTFFSLLLAVTWLQGSAAAIWLIVMRLFQGVGAAFLIANSSAILTDAFPEEQRGMALGINGISGIAGSFIGLVLGGILAPISWRLIFLVNVPVGIAGTLWSYYNLRELPFVYDRKIDWAGNVTFAAGLVALMISVTYGIQPYGGHTMGWTSPLVVLSAVAGIVLLVIFAVVELRSEDPMFHLALFKIRPFTGGSVAMALASISRGGLMFTLIIWLQGVWLPLHGFNFESTPLWAGLAMLPLTIGYLVSGPISGYLSDRYGPRPFTVFGMLLSAVAFGLLAWLPVNFSYPWFAAVLFLIAIGMGVFASPNRAGVMNALPHQHRGVGGGMYATFQNSASVFSIGIFFTLIIVGLSASLHGELARGLLGQGVPLADATRVSHLPAVSTLFASLLGYNPLQHLLGPEVLNGLTPAAHATVISRGFFPSIIEDAFHNGVKAVCAFSILCSLLAAAASVLRGGKFIYQESFEDTRDEEHAPFRRDPAIDAEAFLTQEPSALDERR